MKRKLERKEKRKERVETNQDESEQTASRRQLLVLVQWTGLLPKDTSWEKWENLKEDYNLEDKVVLEARRDVMNEDT